MEMDEKTAGAIITILFSVLGFLLLRSVGIWWLGINNLKTQMKISNFLMIRSMTEEQLAALTEKEKKNIMKAIESEKF